MVLVFKSISQSLTIPSSELNCLRLVASVLLQSRLSGYFYLKLLINKRICWGWRRTPSKLMMIWTTTQNRTKQMVLVLLKCINITSLLLVLLFDWFGLFTWQYFDFFVLYCLLYFGNLLSYFICRSDTLSWFCTVWFGTVNLLLFLRSGIH